MCSCKRDCACAPEWRWCLPPSNVFTRAFIIIVVRILLLVLPPVSGDTKDCTKGIIIIIVIVIFLLSSDRWQVLFMLWCTIGEAIQKMYLFSDKIRKERGESRPIQNFRIKKIPRGEGGSGFPTSSVGRGTWLGCLAETKIALQQLHSLYKLYRNTCIGRNGRQFANAGECNSPSLKERVNKVLSLQNYYKKRKNPSKFSAWGSFMKKNTPHTTEKMSHKHLPYEIFLWK